MQQQTAIKAAILGLMVAGSLGAMGTAVAGEATGHQDMQKCYGVNAAHKNDCNTPGHACSGQDSKARDANAYMEMPKGLCEKIAGGSLKMGDEGMMHHKMVKKADSMGHM